MKRKWEPPHVVNRPLPEFGQNIAACLDSITDGFIALNFDWQYTYVNDSAARFLIKPKEKIIGKNLFEVFPEAKGTAFESNFSKALEERTFRTFEAFYEPLNAWFECRCHPSPEGLAVLFNDTTEKKLRDKEIFIYRELVQHANSAIIRWKRDGTIIFFNEYAQKLFGYSAAEIIGKPVRILVPEVESSGTDLTALIQDIVNHPEQYLSNINENLCRNGRRLWMTWTNRAIYDERGQVKEILAIGTDITRLKQAEESVRKSRAHLEWVLDKTGIGTWFNELPFDRLNWDEQTKRLFFVAPSAEPTIALFWNRLHPDDREPTRLAVETAVRNHSLYDIEHRALHPETGEIRWIRSIGQASYAEDGTPNRFDGINFDITARKQGEAKLQQLNESLEQQVAERTKMAENRANQLRTLVSELTFAEQRERRRLAEILHDHLQQLLVGAKINCEVLSADIGPEHKQIAESVLSLLSDSIQASRSLTAELSPPILQQGSLSTALQWLAQRMKETHDLTVDLQADPAADPKREDITLLLYQSIRELLFNVVKHAEVRSAQVKMTRDQANGLRLTVSDLGPGLDTKTIWEKVQAGSGYGLFSIRERLELLGGSFEIESAPGHGAAFSLVIPFRAAGKEARKVSAQDLDTIRKPQPSKDKIRVLMADDHAVVRQGIFTFLNLHADIEVVGEAADGREAVEKARNLNPDVILMDINMPKMDGLEATRIIHSELPHIRIIGLSMYTQAEQAAAIIAAGACAYRSKSDNTELLLAAIRGETDL